MRLCAPCTVADLADVLGPCHPLTWAAARHQLARSQSYAIRDRDARAIVAGGFWPEPGYREAWFIGAPDAAAHMTAVLRLTRLTYADLCQCDPRPVIAVVRTPAGGRIASVLGFTPLSGGVWRLKKARQ